MSKTEELTIEKGKLEGIKGQIKNYINLQSLTAVQKQELSNLEKNRDELAGKIRVLEVEVELEKVQARIDELEKRKGLWSQDQEIEYRTLKTKRQELKTKHARLQPKKEKVKKEKWEEEYEAALDKKVSSARKRRLKELGRKLPKKPGDGKPGLNKDEMSEYTKLSNLDTAIEQIGRIVELRDKLKDRCTAIQGEITRRKKMEIYKDGFDATIATLDRQMDVLMAEGERLHKELKAERNLEKRQKIKEQIAKIEEKKSTNQDAFRNANQKSNYRVKKDNHRLAGMRTEDLMDLHAKLSMRISVCNLACSKLIKGYSWKNIDAELNKFESTSKLTARGQQSIRMQQFRRVARTDARMLEAPRSNDAIVVRKEPGFLNGFLRFFSSRTARSAQNNMTRAEQAFDESVEASINGQTGRQLRKESFWRRMMQKENPEESVQRAEKEQTEFRAYLRKLAEEGPEKAESDKRESAKQRLDNYRAEALRREEERDNAYAAQRKAESDRAKARNAAARQARRSGGSER